MEEALKAKTSPIRKWRESCGLMQKDLAHEMGLAPSTLSQKETGRLDWDRDDYDFFFKKKGITADKILGQTPIDPSGPPEEE